MRAQEVNTGTGPVEGAAVRWNDYEDGIYFSSSRAQALQQA